VISFLAQGFETEIRVSAGIYFLLEVLEKNLLANFVSSVLFFLNHCDKIAEKNSLRRERLAGLCGSHL
jgi:hypothetical protein